MQKKKKKNIESDLLSLGFEKVFDSVEFKFIGYLMERMNFGESFLNIILTIYRQSFAKIRANSTTSDLFPINRGTRQGCPLSPLLFAISIEPFANLIRSTTSVKGVEIANKEYKLCLFADDVLLFITQPSHTLQNVEKNLNSFSEISGLQISICKSEIYPMYLTQKMKSVLKRQFKFKWTSYNLKYLGIFLPLNFQNLYKENYHRTYLEVKKKLAEWNDLNMSWPDRIDVVKSFIFPTFLFFKFRMLPIFIPQKDLRKWQSLSLNFVWLNKTHRISFKIMCKPSKEGGLGIPDLDIYYQSANLATIVRIIG